MRQTLAVARCPIELNAASHEPESAYLFVEDDGRVLRFALRTNDVRIGRDQSNDIWIDNPAVRPQTCLVYHRDGMYHLKVYDGAKTLLNGQAVRGLSRLYSGDRIGVGDRELLYGRDDTPAQVAIGLTVMLDGVVQYGIAYRRTRVRIGRRNADLVLNDASVADAHMVIECYSDAGLFGFDLGAGSSVNGKSIEERCRLRDGDVLQLGNVVLRVHLLPVEGFGLLLPAPLPARPLVPLGAPKPMDRSPGQRMDPSAASPRSRQGDGRSAPGGFVRPNHNANAALPAAEPPEPVALDQRPAAPEPLPPQMPAPIHDPNGPAATQIGSLQQMLRDAQRAAPGDTFGEPQHTVMADAVRAQLGDYKPRAQSADLPPPLPAAANVPVERPAVRINVEGAAAQQASGAVRAVVQQRPPTRPPPPQPSQGQHAPPVWQDESSQRENLRVRPRETADDQHLVPVVASSLRRGGMGFHDQHTEMLDTASIADGARGTDWQRDPVLRKVFGDAAVKPDGAPSTAVLDTYADPALPPMTRSQRGDEGRQGPQQLPDDREPLRPPAQQGDRYRLGRSTGSHEPPADPAPRPVGRDEEPPPRQGWQDPDRYRLGRGGTPDRRPVQDDRPRVPVRPLTEAEKIANPDWDQPTDRPRGAPTDADASRRDSQGRTIDGSRRGFDRDR